MTDAEYGLPPVSGYKERAEEAAQSLEFGKQIIERLSNGESISLESLAKELGVDEDIVHEQLRAALEQIEKYARMEKGIAGDR